MNDGDREAYVRQLEARVAELEGRRGPDPFRVLSTAAKELLRIHDASALFALLGQRIHAVAEGAIVAITEFDPRRGTVTVRRLECPPEDRPHIVAILGRDPIGLSLGLVDEARERWKSGRLVRVPGGLHDLLFRQVPAAVCDRLARELGLGDAFGMAFAADEEILGSVALLTRPPNRLSNRQLIEQLVALAALALKRIRAEEARQQTEERFRLLFDSTSDGVWIHGLDGIIREVNDAYCAMSGYERGELVGMHVSRLEARETPEEVSEHMARMIQAGGHDRFESRHRRKDGTTIAVDLTTLYVAREGGGVACFVRDITARKNTEDSLRESERRYRDLAARLKEADRHKDEFLAMLAHELRNPLAAIANAAQFFTSNGATGPNVDRAKEAMERQSRHMARLIDDLLDVSRVTQGKVALKRAPVAVADVVEAAVELAAESIEAKRQQLFVSASRQPLLVEGDAVRPTHVLSNLLSNASKYTPPGGEVHLSFEARGAWAAVTVRDTGDGILPGLLPRIFDLFVQGDRGADRVQGGLGIGLTMARSLVEMHGGTIEAHSEGSGKGSQFVVSLPLAAVIAQDAGLTPAAGRSDSLQPRDILVVDDNRDAAEMLRLLLELEGHEVRAAESGIEAIRLAVERPPDVAFIDLGMPGMDGYEVVERLKGLPSLARTTLVALTGYGQAEDVERCRRSGFHRHLVKPASLDALREVLQNAPEQP